jgi:hypothetical protein
MPIDANNSRHTIWPQRLVGSHFHPKRAYLMLTLITNYINQVN